MSDKTYPSNDTFYKSLTIKKSNTFITKMINPTLAVWLKKIYPASFD